MQHNFLPSNSSHSLDVCVCVSVLPFCNSTHSIAKWPMRVYSPVEYPIIVEKTMFYCNWDATCDNQTNPSIAIQLNTQHAYVNSHYTTTEQKWKINFPINCAIHWHQWHFSVTARYFDWKLHQIASESHNKYQFDSVNLFSFLNVSDSLSFHFHLILAAVVVAVVIIAVWLFCSIPKCVTISRHPHTNKHTATSIQFVVCFYLPPILIDTSCSFHPHTKLIFYEHFNQLIVCSVLFFCTFFPIHGEAKDQFPGIIWKLYDQN